MTVSGSTNGMNSTRLDNIQFNATPIPKPSTATALLAAAGWVGMRRRRAMV